LKLRLCCIPAILNGNESPAIGDDQLSTLKFRRTNDVGGRSPRIVNRRGLHARASAQFVNLAAELPAKIEVEKDSNRVTGTSIMGLMMLGAAMGDSIVVHVEGDDAEAVLEKLVALVESGFGEESG